VVPGGGDDPVTALGLLVLAVWVGLLLFRDGFWLTRERDDGTFVDYAAWPSVVAVVPARDEADVIARAAGSLAAQDYPGDFRAIVVDDNSSDATAALARAEGVDVLGGAPLAPGWTGKLWAVSQGIEAAGTPDYLWLTDADIAHDPDTLRALVAVAVSNDLTLVSLMARLSCTNFSERLLVPAFVLFFQMLFPFRRVNRPGGTAAAAGGCMLVRRDALEAAGGIAAVRGAIIDDCAVGALMKRQGPIRLLLTRRSMSLRPYRSISEIGAMIARSAYAQLGYSPWKLAGTLAGLALIFLTPPLLSLAGHGIAKWSGLAAWGLMTLAFQPMLRFYGRSPLWGVALPVIGAIYGWYTWLSAVRQWQGRGGLWKGRAQAMARP